MSEEFDFSGDFINENNVIENDILTIVSKPFAEQKESATTKEMVNGVLVNKKYMVLNLPVEINGKKKTYTVPDRNTGLRFQAEWGKDHSTWIGKQFKAKIEAYKAYGADKKRVAGYPLVSEKV